MIPIKSERDLRIMRQACAIAATVLDRLCQEVREGVSTWDIDQAAKKFMAEYSCRSACYKYRSGGLRYPNYVCISVNDEVIHGIGRPDRVLKRGDIASLDVCVIYKGFVGDNTRTVAVGECAPETARLIDFTARALEAGIGAAREGNRVGDISAAVQEVVESGGYGIVRDFTGHGVGKGLHEEPPIPNFGRSNTGPLLRAGMTLAIEPMTTMNPSGDISFGDDGWTVSTPDGKPSCHIEHTVLVRGGGLPAEILTKPLDWRNGQSVDDIFA
ncbi:MAG: type I methionyl aminopeptidase [Verrucomicrobia bacterium]|nr:MAG: type I methionyl aminopeptidase [Verrucomicrobiota bacterium]